MAFFTNLDVDLTETLSGSRWVHMPSCIRIGLAIFLTLRIMPNVYKTSWIPARLIQQNLYNLLETNTCIMGAEYEHMWVASHNPILW